MTARHGDALDRLARLEEQRDDLLASLDALDDELARGVIDEHDHAELADDLTRRTAEVLRRIDDVRIEPVSAARLPARRRLLAVGGLVAVAVVAGIAVATASGLRLAGEFGTGGIDRSSRDLLLRAEVAFGEGRLDDAAATIDEVLARVPDDPDALLLRARVHERAGDVLESLMTLDRVLAVDPDQVEALTLKGWILARLPEEDLWTQGIELLDAAIAQEPSIFDPYLFRAIAAERLEGDAAAAERYYRAALERNPPAAMVPQIEGFIAALEAG